MVYWIGDVEKASRVFVRNELIPLQKRLEELNHWLGEEVIHFAPYNLETEKECLSRRLHKQAFFMHQASDLPWLIQSVKLLSVAYAALLHSKENTC